MNTNLNQDRWFLCEHPERHPRPKKSSGLQPASLHPAGSLGAVRLAPCCLRAVTVLVTSGLLSLDQSLIWIRPLTVGEILSNDPQSVVTP